MNESKDYYFTLTRMIKAVAFARNLTEEQFAQCRIEAGYKVIAVMPVGHVVVINQMSTIEKNWVSWKMHEILWSKLFGIAEAFPLMEPNGGRPNGDLSKAPEMNFNASWGPVMNFIDEVTNEQHSFTDYVKLRESRAAAAAIEKYKAENEKALEVVVVNPGT